MSGKWELKTAVMERLSNRVAYWFTINKAECIIALGHQDGVYAPGFKLSLQENALAAHHLLLDLFKQLFG